MGTRQEVIVPCNTSTTLSAHLIVKRNPELLLSMNSDEPSVYLNNRDNKCYFFGHTGSRIWELLQEPVKVEHLVQLLLDEYSIDRMTCESELFSFLAKLSEERLIRFQFSF